MIYIKDKGNRTHIYIPRQGDVVVDYANKEYIDDKIAEMTEEITDILEGINNKLETILI